MQCGGGSARASGLAHVQQVIGLANCLFKPLFVVHVNPSLSSGIGSHAAKIRITMSSTAPEKRIGATLNSMSRGPYFQT